MDMLNSMEQSAIEPVNISTTTPQEFNPSFWPVQPGDYKVFDPTASIALLLLGNTKNIDSTFFSSLGNIAIVGPLTTENIGIEYVIKNLISNPFIRHLAVTGQEISGHRPGDAIINLNLKGVDENQKIVDASGARPILRNTLPQEIEHFREQITVHNFLGCCEADSLKKEILLLKSLDSAPYKNGLYVRLVDIIEATPAKRLQLDPEGYFIILARKGKENPLYVEHYKNSGRLSHIIEGKDAATICSTIISMKLVSRIDHAAYLSRELAKAEFAIRRGATYTQDAGQGELPQDEKCGDSTSTCHLNVPLDRIESRIPKL
jgi:tetrahydromethanopterin S-methyltransferase subunit A